MPLSSTYVHIYIAAVGRGLSHISHRAVVCLRLRFSKVQTGQVQFPEMDRLLPLLPMVVEIMDDEGVVLEEVAAVNGNRA